MENEIVGFAGYNKNFISFLFVDSKHYGKKIGTKLLSYILNQMKEKVWLIVAKNNTIAQNQYKKFKFEIIDEFIGKYNGINVKVIKLELNKGLMEETVKRMEGRRVILKSIKPEDREDIYEVTRNPEVSKYLAWTFHKTINETDEWVKEVLMGYEAGNIFSWGIYNKETKKFMGWIGFDEHFPLELRCEIGYWLGIEYWNQGYMTEVLKIIIEYCEKELKYKKIEAIHAVENPISGIVMKKFGFKKEGLIKDYVFVKNRMWDIIAYSITKGNENI